MKKLLHLYKVVVGNVNEGSVDPDARWNVVAFNVEDAIRKVRKSVERGEAIMSVERIAYVDKV